MQQSSEAHFQALQNTFNYVYHTAGQGIILHAAYSLSLQAFSDFNWGTCIDTRRFVIGYLLLFGKSPISSKSKNQSIVSKSSSEVEYRAMSSVAFEITWTVRLLEELGISDLRHVTLHCDNQSALNISHNPVLHDHTKHIVIDYHFTQEKVMEGILQLTYLPTTSQLADVFSKILPSGHFRHLLYKLGTFDPPILEGGC